MTVFNLFKGARRPLTSAELRLLHNTIEAARQRRYPFVPANKVFVRLDADFNDLPPAVRLVCNHLVRSGTVQLAALMGQPQQYDPLAVFWWASLVRHPADAALWAEVLLQITVALGAQSILGLVQHFDSGVPDGTMSLMQMLGRA